MNTLWYNAAGYRPLETWLVWRWGACYGQWSGLRPDHREGGARPGPQGSTDPPGLSDPYFWKNALEREGERGERERERGENVSVGSKLLNQIQYTIVLFPLPT
jgi:hypothetical protein